MFDYLLASPNWSEIEIEEYTPKAGDGIDEEIIKCSRECIITIPNKGLAIFRSEKYLIIPIEIEKNPRRVVQCTGTNWYKWDEKEDFRRCSSHRMMIFTRSCSHIQVLAIKIPSKIVFVDPSIRKMTEVA